MPNVVGMSITKAKRVLTAANLKVRTVQDTTSLKPAGIVLKQDSPADKPILEGSEVVLRVSAGQATTVPGLVDLPLDQAQALLAAAGLSAEITQQPADAPAGTVLSQDAAAGTVVLKGSIVRLVVSSGPKAPHPK
jgi:serine/threonine-protein kinase